ncbi:MAG TPA: antitoxin [Thermoanaerobaculia bacterium]|nr:antitoxin [Thermoanaerobaculia bacterium]
MSKPLQILLDDPEIQEIEETARRHQMTVDEWVRQALRTARQQAVDERARKIEAVRTAAQYAFPTGDIEEVLADIERGYLDDGPR